MGAERPTYTVCVIDAVVSAAAASGRGAILKESFRHGVSWLRRREATLIYLRPASCALATASTSVS